MQALMNIILFCRQDQKEKFKYSVISTFITIAVQCYSSFLFSKTPFEWKLMLSGFMINKILRSAFNIYLNYKIMMYVLADVFALVNDTISCQNNIIEVMQSLEEGIITNTPSGLGFCNKKGLKILKEINTSRKKKLTANTATNSASM